MGTEIFENISKLIKNVWPFIVTGCAMLTTLTVIKLNLYRIKKIKLEIEKLEKEMGSEPSNEEVDAIKTSGKGGPPTIEWPK